MEQTQNKKSAGQEGGCPLLFEIVLLIIDQIILLQDDQVANNWSDYIAARWSSWLDRCLSCPNAEILEIGQVQDLTQENVIKWLITMMCHSIWYMIGLSCAVNMNMDAYTDNQWGPQVTDPPLAFIWLGWSRRNNLPHCLSHTLATYKKLILHELSSG